MKGKFGGEGRVKLEGSSIGAWYVDRYLGEGRYFCVCVCGRQKAVDVKSLTTNSSRSCGCKAGEMRAERKSKQAAGKAPVKCPPKYE